MNFENFAYWLQGFFEMTDSKNLSPNQVLMIKEHLKLVFEKKTPQIDPNIIPILPTQWYTTPICQPGIGGAGTGQDPDAWKVKVTCHSEDSGQSGVSTNQNLDTNLFCSKGPEGTTGQLGAVDEHAHAGQARRMIVVSDLPGNNPSGSIGNFVNSKMNITC